MLWGIAIMSTDSYHIHENAYRSIADKVSWTWPSCKVSNHPSVMQELYR